MDLKGKSYFVKNPEISVVLIFLGSKQADCKGFSAFVMSAFNRLCLKKKKKENVIKMAIENFSSLKAGFSVKLKSNNIFKKKNSVKMS